MGRWYWGRDAPRTGGCGRADGPPGVAAVGAWGACSSVMARRAWRSRIGRILPPMHDEHLIETPVGGRVVHQGRYLTFRQDTVQIGRAHV